MCERWLQYPIEEYGQVSIYMCDRAGRGGREITTCNDRSPSSLDL